MKKPKLQTRAITKDQLSFFGVVLHGATVLNTKTKQAIRRPRLKTGEKVLAPGIWGHELAVVQPAKETKRRTAHSKHNGYLLQYDQDDRHCWTSACSYSLKALVRVRLA